MGSFNMIGSLPSSLGDLTDLQSINWVNNSGEEHDALKLSNVPRCSLAAGYGTLRKQSGLSMLL